MKILHFLFSILFLSILFSIVYGASFNVNPTQSSADSGASNWKFNFTINNTNSTANIIQLNITLPEGFEFIDNSNSTNTPSNFSYDAYSRNLIWTNSTSLINASSFAWFSFNLSIPLIFKTVNFTFTVLDNSDIINTTNASVVVIPESVSTSREFGLLPKIVYINWTNNYETNLSVLSNSTSDISIVFVNETNIAANYSQVSESNGPWLYIRLKNNTGNFSNINFLPSFGNTNYTLFKYCVESGWGPCRPGRYFGIFTIKNSSNLNENASLEVVVDLPISLSPETGIGNFNGLIPGNTTKYHSFYFNVSDIPNATSITLNLNFNNGDLDVFLLTYETQPKLLAKSINKEGNESLTYNFLKNQATYEIRIYGNSSSGISYTGNVIVLTLNSSEQEFDFGTQNVSGLIEKVFNLTNEGNSTIQNVEESAQIFYVKRFGGNGSKNFTFFLPDSSIMPTLKVKLNWTEEGAYKIKLFNPEGIEVGSSFNKSWNAKVSNVEKEEFIESNNSEKAGFWRVEVENMTTNNPFYNLTIQAFVNPSEWIKTNFTAYTNKTFDIVGKENSTKNVKLNFTVPDKAISGVYEGFLIYKASNGGMIKIPIRVNVTTPVLVVNNTLQTKEIVIEENFHANLTKTFYLNISNFGDYELTTSFLNSTRLNCVGCPYFANLSFNTTTEIQPGSSSLIEVNISFNSSMPKNSVYLGWIFINSTHSNDPNLTSHPYSSFNISIKLNLTDRWNVMIVKLKSRDYGNNTVNVSSKASWVNTSFLIQYVNGTNVSAGTIFSLKNITNVWLKEPNASYVKENLQFTNITPEKATLPGDVWVINLTIPPNLPGGKYYIHINLTSENLSSNPSDVYRGESLDDPINEMLIVDDMGLLMSLTSYPSSLPNGTSEIVNVTIKNLGPRDATNVQITLEKCSYISSVSFLNSSCSLVGSASNKVNFTLSAYNYTGCYVAWKITAGNTDGSCTSWINGTSGLWFNNLPFETEIYSPVTTTTTIPNITTTTTSTITTTTSTTTTSTIPSQTQMNYTIRIPSITIDSPATIEINQAETLKIRRITIFVKRDVNNVMINIAEVKPENIPEPIKIGESLVMKYLEILPTNIFDDDILAVTIDFQVDKLWVNENGIDVATIALYRYSNKTWGKLQTTKLNETSDYYIFRSISPGLSLFAIAGIKTKVFPIWIIFLIFGIIVACVLAFLFWPVEEEKPIVKGKEEKEIKKPWEELKKKWDELIKRKRS